MVFNIHVFDPYHDSGGTAACVAAGRLAAADSTLRILVRRHLTPSVAHQRVRLHACIYVDRRERPSDQG